AVFSSRFADIFRGNSGKAGMLTGIMEQSDIELLWKLMEQTPGLELTVNLEKQIVTAGDVVISFEVDPYIRWRLMEGLDDAGLTLRKLDEIEDYEAKRPAFKP